MSTNYRLCSHEKMGVVRRKSTVVHAQADNKNEAEEDDGFVQNTEFGYSRKDVILITFGTFVLGYVIKAALQIGGIEDLKVDSTEISCVRKRGGKPAFFLF